MRCLNRSCGKRAVIFTLISLVRLLAPRLRVFLSLLPDRACDSSLCMLGYRVGPRALCFGLGRASSGSSCWLWHSDSNRPNRRHNTRTRDTARIESSFLCGTRGSVSGPRLRNDRIHSRNLSSGNLGPIFRRYSDRKRVGFDRDWNLVTVSRDQSRSAWVA